MAVEIRFGYHGMDIEGIREELDRLYNIVLNLKNRLESGRYTQGIILSDINAINALSEALSSALNSIYRTTLHNPIYNRNLDHIKVILEAVSATDTAFRQALVYGQEYPEYFASEIYGAVIDSLPLLERARRELSILISGTV